jgi:hypothetical protein
MLTETLHFVCSLVVQSKKGNAKTERSSFLAIPASEHQHQHPIRAHAYLHRNTNTKTAVPSDEDKTKQKEIESTKPMRKNADAVILYQNIRRTPFLS